jgi:hypothetical protein
MSATWIRVAAATVGTLAIVASAPMIASATEGRQQTSDDRTSVSLPTKDAEKSSKGDASNRSSKDDKGTRSSKSDDKGESSGSHGDDSGHSESGEDGHNGGGNGGGGNAGGGNAGGGHAVTAKATIIVGVPAIAFTKDIVSTGGQLRAPVLINAAERAGTSTLFRDGIATSCTVPAQPGVVAWLQCSLNNSSGREDSGSESTSKTKGTTPHTYTVVVKTTNGLTATHAVTVA